MDDFDAEAVVNGMRALSEVFKYLDDALTAITENLHVLSEAYIAQIEDTEEDSEGEDSDIPELTDDFIKRSDALKSILGVSIYDTIEELEGARTISENTWADGLYGAYKIIEDEVDATDVEPKRKTGRWVYKHRTQVHYHKETGEDVITGEKRTVMVYTDLSGKYPHCPYCDALAADSFTDYCPHCGAQMLPEPPKENENAE